MTVEGLCRVLSEVTITAFCLIGLNEANTKLRLVALIVQEEHHSLGSHIVYEALDQSKLSTTIFTSSFTRTINST